MGRRSLTSTLSAVVEAIQHTFSCLASALLLPVQHLVALQVRIWAQTQCDTRRLQGAMMQVVQAQGPMAMPVVGTVCGPMPMVCQAPVVPRINSVT